jgi:hypothetical protein
MSWKRDSSFDVNFFWSLASLSLPLTASRLLTLHLYGVDREYSATPFFDVIPIELLKFGNVVQVMPRFCHMTP